MIYNNIKITFDFPKLSSIVKTMKIICLTCGKQAIKEQVSIDHQYLTTLIGAKASFKPNECFCGHCAKELDENGLFPEERLTIKNYPV